MTIDVIKIFPPIGIARLGNSPPDWPIDQDDKGEWFIGPEIPGMHTPSPPWDGHYKDSKLRIKRQAARFHIFGGATDAEAGSADAKEIEPADADIQWTVELANTKAAWRVLGQGVKNPPPPDHVRNNAVQNRDSLKITPPSRTVDAQNPRADFKGNFFGDDVFLGEIRMETDGRLVVLGGLGHSGSPRGFPGGPLPLHTVSPGGVKFADNDGWYDDVSDGPVNASVRLKGTNKWIRAAPAWVICAPPKFAPPIEHIITLYDTLLQVAVDRKLLGWSGLLPTGRLYFTKDIYPLLARAMNMKWVSSAAGVMHGTIHEVMPAPNSSGPAGSPGDRQTIFNRLSVPHDPGTDPRTQVSSIGGHDMPKIWSDYYPDAVNETLTKTQYQILQRWSNWVDDDDIKNDWVGHPIPETRITPDGLTRAALENCVGGAFYPGIETSFVIRDTYTFMEPFRLDPTPPHNDPLQPGDLTKQMAVPWQVDFFDCSYDDLEGQVEGRLWWPAARPDDVFLDNGSQLEWTRDIIFNYVDMIDNWHKLGFVVQKPDTDPPQYIETERHG